MQRLAVQSPNAPTDLWTTGNETFTDDRLTPLPVSRGRRYEVLRPLGRGASAEVLLAMDHEIGRPIALKRFHIGGTISAEARFEQEIKTLGQLEHPHIVPIHDVGRDERGPYFVMRLAKGETLTRVLQRLRAGDPIAHDRYTFAVRAQIVLSVLSALSHAHAEGIVHRDIKPANIMVGNQGEVQVLDWGVATRTVDEPHERTVVGTPRYMSPEQARAERIDERSDLYSVGVLLHELLTLEHYLDHVDNTVDAVLEGVCTCPVPPARLSRSPLQPRVPVELSAVATRATSKDPRHRYADAEHFASELRRALDGSFDVHCPISLQKRALRRATELVDRNPAALPALLAANFTAMGGMALALAWLLAG